MEQKIVKGLTVMSKHVETHKLLENLTIWCKKREKLTKDLLSKTDQHLPRATAGLRAQQTLQQKSSTSRPAPK